MLRLLSLTSLIGGKLQQGNSRFKKSTIDLLISVLGCSSDTDESRLGNGCSEYSYEHTRTKTKKKPKYTSVQKSSLEKISSVGKEKS